MRGLTFCDDYFPFLVAKGEIWDGETLAYGTPAATAPHHVAVGPGTDYPVGMTLEQMSQLYWRVKHLKVTGSGESTLLGRDGSSGTFAGTWFTRLVGAYSWNEFSSEVDPETFTILNEATNLKHHDLVVPREQICDFQYAAYDVVDIGDGTDLGHPSLTESPIFDIIAPTFTITPGFTLPESGDGGPSGAVLAASLYLSLFTLGINNVRAAKIGSTYYPNLVASISVGSGAVAVGTTNQSAVAGFPDYLGDFSIFDQTAAIYGDNGDATATASISVTLPGSEFWTYGGIYDAETGERV